ncbi:restriction endonuclease, partial [Pseudomonas sp. SIMBA_059]
QAVAVPRGRDAGAAYVRDFVERRLAEGFIRGALLASGQTDVSAPR